MTEYYTEYIRQREWTGKKVYRYEVLDSTNVRLRRLAEEGAVHGAVVTAGMQTAGRGRRGRSWSSADGAGLWFSMLLRPDILPEDAPMLTLVAAMAAVRAIERVTGISPEIKWPNDLVLSGKKVCGILTEMNTQKDGSSYIILGMGINVKNQEFPEEIEETATSLEKVCGCEVSMELLLEAVLKEFEELYAEFIQNLDLSFMQREYNRRLVNLDRQVRIMDAKSPYEGIARGINARGELLVEKENQMHTVNAGEVSVRGIYGYV